MAAIVAPTCEHCGKDGTKLRRIITGSGVSMVAWRCMICDRWAKKPVQWLKHDELCQWLQSRWRAGLDDIPIVNDYSDQTPCAICGAPGQWHHWAPQAWAEQFGEEWTKWPCTYLCERHHQLWHRIVTPALVGWKKDAA
jgi:hypothetical protein